MCICVGWIAIGYLMGEVGRLKLECKKVSGDLNGEMVRKQYVER